MADLLKDKRMEIVEKAIAKGKKRQGYKPDRETDKYILDRLRENVPGWRPRDLVRDQTIDSASDLRAGPWGAEGAMRLTPDKHYSWGETVSTKRNKLKGWENYKKALNSNLRILGAADKQAMQDLQNEVAEDMTAPGAQEDRPGRVQEILEALDFGNPESGGRAALRELKRLAIDDRLPRTQMGWKKTPGEELLKAKLEELGLKDIPRNRALAMQELGWTNVPKEAMARDQHGNPVPLYVDEMKAAREAAAEKAYMQGRRDPMKDTQERD